VNGTQLPNCPCCHSEAEEYFIVGVTVCCSNDKCSVSTENHDNLADAHAEWIEICQRFKIEPGRAVKK
jgi:hypothetical protein